MNASSLRPRINRDVKLILRRDGSEIHLDEIATAAEGQAILDEVDAAILAIEGQIETTTSRADPNWRRRAHTALKVKRRSRPALQQRIAELRRAERQALSPRLQAEQTSSGNLRRVAFINAAETTLDRDLYVEIWQRAAEAEPAVFEGWQGVAPHVEAPDAAS